MSDFALGPGRRDALLIATGRYDDRTLSTLRSPGQDCASLAGVLADPGIGAFRTEQVRDAPAHQVMRAVERFFMDRSRDDLLLLHISCHGIKDDDGRLYFAARDTDRDLPASTAVPAAFLRERMERCRARTVVVLLDCCYSGAFLPGSKGDDQIHVRDELGGHGRAVLTATNRTEYAWEGEHVESKVPQPSRFTGALIEGLRTGAADLDGDGRITVTEWYDYVYESLHRAGVKQRPRMWAELEYRVTVALAVGGRRSDARATRPPTTGTPAAVTLDTPPPAADRSFSDIMDAFFAESAKGGPDATAQRPERHPGPRRQRGQDAVIRVEFTLEETGLGTVKELQLDTAILCPTCSGSGAARGATVDTCHACEGTGSRRRAFGRSGKNICPECDGSGTLLSALCEECAGDARVRSRRTISVRVPGGVDNGSRIQLSGEGEVGPGGGPPGDLYIEVAELPHRRFRRVGDDLHCDLTITAHAAKSGTTMKVATLDGHKTIRIPSGTPDGRTIRIIGQGVKHLRSDGRGDLLARTRIRG
ncbi:DnaJ C-terminal domain-containing protein [Streptomyces sp. NPDC057616]|uniref:caspase, EACC1-associated type n=1 Tax=Streptomyces sp. NPDC057616 TaxID=3346183 RepID=UPI0036BC26E3